MRYLSLSPLIGRIVSKFFTIINSATPNILANILLPMSEFWRDASLPRNGITRVCIASVFLDTANYSPSWLNQFICLTYFSFWIKMKNP